MAFRLICRLFSTPQCKALGWKWQFTLTGVRCDFWYWKEGRGRYRIFKMCVCVYLFVYGGFPGGSEVKVSACNAGDLGSIPGLGRSPGEGNGNPFQYSCLEKPMDRGAWWAIVHGIHRVRHDWATSLHFNIQKNTIKLKFIPLANIFWTPD